MIAYLVRRSLHTLVLLVVVSMLSFLIIQAPPGDYVTTLVTQLEAQGQSIDEARAAGLRRRYGLDRPLPAQYWLWVSGFPRGDFGFSFEWERPVGELIAERLGYTVGISLLTLFIAYAVSIPIGIYSATHQYSIGDYVLTFLSFVGVAVPSFMVALVLMFLAFRYLNMSPGGLFSPKYLDAPWGWGKFVDMLSHLPVPLIIIGLGGTAYTIRVLRGNLLDELRKPYVVTARAKGLPERRLLYKYPVRYALNPLASGLGWVLSGIVSGATIVSIVLNLPTVGPMLLRALLSQDMYLAGSLIMFLCILTVVGMLLSDILLSLLNPRIRYG